MYTHFKTWLMITYLMLFYRKFTLKRFGFFLGTVLVISVFWITNFIFRFLDEIFYPNYKKQKVKKPIFIIGNPRSGTTFLYDLMAQDTENFSQPKLYQTILCSVTLYKLMRFLHRLQTKKKRITKTSSSGFNKFFEKFKAIHKINLSRSEEDEGLFFLTLLSPSLYFVCPFIDKIPYLSIIDNMPEKVKLKLIKYYQNSIKRYMYMYGNNKIYFCKNVMSSGKIKLIKQAFPDAIIINPVRHPYKAIPSMISFHHVAWKLHSPEVLGASKETKALANVMAGLYKHMLKCKDDLGKDLIVVKFEDIVKNPLESVQDIYKKLKIKQPAKLDEKISKFINKKDHKSEHSYSLEKFGLNKTLVYKDLKNVFDFYNFEN